jgi:hypothetical protein
MLNDLLNPVALWIKSTALSAFITESDWAWYTCETVHFVGLALLIGAVGILDLRMLGIAKQLPVGPLHRLIPWGVLGFILCVVSGGLFVVGEPGSFLTRDAFQYKMLFIVLAGLNVVLFYVFMYREVEALGADDDAPPLAKVIAGTSLLLWFGVIYWGRLMGVA